MVAISDLKSDALTSATYDTVLQVFLRVLSFLLNAFVIRHLTPSVIAVITVRLHLLYTTGLLLSREAFRRASLGCKSTGDVKKVVNLIWVGAGLSLPLCMVGWVIWNYGMETPPPDVTKHYKVGIAFILCAIIVEVCSESPYILAELHLWAKMRVLIEGAMQLCRTLLLAIGVFLIPQKAVLAFGIAHLAGSLFYSATYYIIFAMEFKQKRKVKNLLVTNFRGLFVTFTQGKFLPEVDLPMWKVSVSFLKQGVLKEALTEGEFYLMNLFPLISLPDQGIYQVVSNLGSLAARLLFRSIEAVAYKFFVCSLHRGKLIKDQDKSKMNEVSAFLSSLLKNLILISLLVVTFGWAYSHTLLQLYGGSTLSSAGRGILRAQFFYVVFLALNGIVEAFVFATMSDDQLARHNYMLILFSVIYVGVTVVSTYIVGVYGFIIGNCVNMMLRICCSIQFMDHLFEGSGLKPLKSLMVSSKVVLTLILALIFTSLSEVYIYPSSMFRHLLVGLICGCFVFYVLRESLQDIIELLFNFVDKIYSNCFSKSTRGQRFTFPLLNIIYHRLYR